MQGQGRYGQGHGLSKAILAKVKFILLGVSGGLLRPAAAFRPTMRRPSSRRSPGPIVSAAVSGGDRLPMGMAGAPRRFLPGGPVPALASTTLRRPVIFDKPSQGPRYAQANLSVAATRARLFGGSKALWPLSGVMMRSASGHSRWSAHALSMGQTTS